MTPFEILGFDSKHAVHIETYDQLLIVLEFAKENGFPDDCVDDPDDWFDYPYVVLSSGESEMNAYANTDWLESYVEFDDWYNDFIGNENPKLNLETLSELI